MNLEPRICLEGSDFYVELIDPEFGTVQVKFLITDPAGEAVLPSCVRLPAETLQMIIQMLTRFMSV